MVVRVVNEEAVSHCTNITTSTTYHSTYRRSPGGDDWTSVDFSSVGLDSGFLCHALRAKWRGCQTATASMELLGGLLRRGEGWYGAGDGRKTRGPYSSPALS